jgi:hypothetical protein
MMTVDYKTEREFLNREIAIWGIEEIENLIERGFRIVVTPDGVVTWFSETDVEADEPAGDAKADLTNGDNCATLIPARRSFLPFRVMLTSSGVSA